MTYYVIAPNGGEYGPADEELLRKWISENRIDRSTQLRDAITARQFAAGEMNHLFSAPVPPPPVNNNSNPPIANYPRPGLPPNPIPAVDGPNVLMGIAFRCALALLSVFVFKGIGLIFGGFALYHAIRLKKMGSRYGTAAIIMSAVTLILVAVGWIIRYSR